MGAELYMLPFVAATNVGSMEHPRWYSHTLFTFVVDQDAHPDCTELVALFTGGHTDATGASTDAPDPPYRPVSVNDVMAYTGVASYYQPIHGSVPSLRTGEGTNFTGIIRLLDSLGGRAAPEAFPSATWNSGLLDAEHRLTEHGLLGTVLKDAARYEITWTALFPGRVRDRVRNMCNMADVMSMAIVLKSMQTRFVGHALRQLAALPDAVDGAPSFHVKLLNRRVGYYEETPLMIAAYHGTALAIQTMLEMGADPALRTTVGNTAFGYLLHRQPVQIGATHATADAFVAFTEAVHDRRAYLSMAQGAVGARLVDRLIPDWVVHPGPAFGPTARIVAAARAWDAKQTRWSPLRSAWLGAVAAATKAPPPS
jgi:hypothetical protein